MYGNTSGQISQLLNLSEHQVSYAGSYPVTSGKNRSSHKHIIFNEKGHKIVNWVLSNGSNWQTKLNDIAKVSPELELRNAGLRAVWSALKMNNLGRRVARKKVVSTSENHN